jgi:hypothetical protein
MSTSPKPARAGVGAALRVSYVVMLWLPGIVSHVTVVGSLVEPGKRPMNLLNHDVKHP